jgi:hypothetical protein
MAGDGKNLVAISGDAGSAELRHRQSRLSLRLYRLRLLCRRRWQHWRRENHRQRRAIAACADDETRHPAGLIVEGDLIPGALRVHPGR